jgi:DNA-binding transcriptional MerR regulator
MSDATYTTAQVYHRLDIPKPTIRNWSAEYAQFLSDRARPDDGKTRVFTHDDLVVLNTVRHFTRVEGLNSNEHIREILASGQRIAELPARRTPEEEQALESIQLVPAAQVERALDQVAMLQSHVEQTSRSAREIETERDQALIALDEANREITSLREIQGRIRGILVGVSAAGIGLGLLILAAIIEAAIYVAQVKP